MSDLVQVGEVALDMAERAELARYERVIERGLQTFVEVGNALAAIRDRRLYREAHSTFEGYCQERWEIQRAHAYRLIDGAAVVKELSPVGDILPTSERQVRPLTKLEPEQRQEAWNEAVETAPNGKVTSGHVAKVAVTFAKPDLSKRAPVAPAREPFVRPKPVLAKPTYVEPTTKRDPRLSSATALRGSLNAARDLATHHDHLFEYEQGITAMLSSLNERIAQLEGPTQ